MFGKKRDKTVHDVVFFSYPKLLYCWPLIVIGPLFWLLVSLGGPRSAEYSELLELLGWTYLFITAMVILTIAIDLERNYMVFWMLAFFCFFFLGLWLVEWKDRFTFFGDIYGWCADRDIQYDHNFALMLSIFLAGPYGVMIVWSRLQHRWRITHNEFEHYSFGRADDSLARGAKRVRSTYPDVLEMLLGFGAGTLVVYSATGRSELRRITNVPFLPLVRRKINRILEVTAVTSDREAAIIDGETSEEAEANESNAPIELAGDGKSGNEPL